MDDKEMIAFQDARIFALLRDIERATEREAYLIERVEELELEVTRLRSVIGQAALWEEGPTKPATGGNARLQANHAAQPEAPTRAFHVLAGLPDDSDPRGGRSRLPVSAATGDVTPGVDSLGGAETREDVTRTLAEIKANQARVWNERIQQGSVLAEGAFIAARGITVGALRRDLQQGRVFAIDVDGEKYYPSFFTDDALDRRRLSHVLRLLENLHVTERFLFFTTPRASLNRRTPIDAMREGDYALVRRAAVSAAIT